MTNTEFHPARAAAWDQVANGELAFDFTMPPAAKQERRPAFETSKEKSGVKEAILRWLDEQL